MSVITINFQKQKNRDQGLHVLANLHSFTSDSIEISDLTFTRLLEKKENSPNSYSWSTEKLLSWVSTNQKMKALKNIKGITINKLF